MNFDHEELALLEDVIEDHSDILLNDEDDHGVIQVRNLYKLLKLMREKKNG
jgi:hypothetical protein